MKSQQNPHEPLRRSLHFWAYHTGWSVSSLSRWLPACGVHAKRRTANPGVTLREVLAVIPYR